MYISHEKHARESGVELFRCLVMFLIVVHHVWFKGGFRANGDAWWSVFFFALIIWHVDAFVAISGWFGIRFTWRKFFSVYGVIAFYSCVRSIVEWCLFGRLSFKISGGWFGGCYLMLMLMSPMLNAAVDAIAEKSKRVLMVSWALFAGGYVLTWAPGHLMTGVQGFGIHNLTLITIVGVYVTARVMRKIFDKPVPLRWLVALALSYPVFILICGFGRMVYQMFGRHPIQVVWNSGAVYFAPQVVGAAMILLMLFVWYVKPPRWLGRLAVTAAPSMFAVYLIHDCSTAGHLLYMLPIGWMEKHGSLHSVVVIVIAALVTFISCVFIDSFRRLAVRHLSGIWGWLDRMDDAWNMRVLGCDNERYT